MSEYWGATEGMGKIELERTGSSSAVTWGIRCRTASTLKLAGWTDGLISRTRRMHSSSGRGPGGFSDLRLAIASGDGTEEVRWAGWLSATLSWRAGCTALPSSREATARGGGIRSGQRNHAGCVHP